MDDVLLVVADIAAIAVLAFALYFPRYHRRDIVVAIIGINVGVLAIAAALSSVDVGIGVGFGLFAVLSLIRLRSAELEQEEIAYYFCALALGVLGGIRLDPYWLTFVLMGTILVALLVADHPQLMRRVRHQTMTLDAAFTDEAALHARLEQLLDGPVMRVKVKKVNLVAGTTIVDVRYRLPSA
ncbi:MAG: DUF4956 domain-containing protein [Acidimicrobiales bacterium]|nr:DUF4956 domain-containing protein [Acidimicrobiales bacterium]